MSSYYSGGMGSVRQVEYTDDQGRISVRLIPIFAHDDEAAHGVVIGPPPLASMNLPLDLEVRVNNEFYYRGLLTERDISKRRGDAVAALMSALRVDINRLLAALAAPNSSVEEESYAQVS